MLNNSCTNFTSLRSVKLGCASVKKKKNLLFYSQLSLTLQCYLKSSLCEECEVWPFAKDNETDK